MEGKEDDTRGAEDPASQEVGHEMVAPQQEEKKSTSIRADREPDPVSFNPDKDVPFDAQTLVGEFSFWRWKFASSIAVWLPSRFRR